MRFRIISTVIITVFMQSTTLIAQSLSSISSGRELPATAIIPYDSSEAALEGKYVPSAYLQPLSEWSKEQNGANTVYTTEFKKPFAWSDRLLLLHLDGAGGSYNITVNGQQAGWNQSGMTPFDFDITKYSIEGSNTLKIEVLGNDQSRLIENRQSSGAGRSAVSTDLLGNTYIYSPPKVRVRDYVINTGIVAAGGFMELGLILKSALLNSRDVTLSYELFSPQGQLIGQGRRDASIDMRREDTIRFLVNIPEPKQWSHEAPNLYTVVVRNMFDGRYTEYVSFKTAFINLDRGESKLIVNNVHVNMVAVEYEPGSEMALVEKELTDMKKQGVNTLKIKCVPQAEPFYNLCDKLGFYVCVQADINSHKSGGAMKLGGNPSNDPWWIPTYKDRAQGVLHTSKGHPSVVMISLAENSSNGICLYESYLALKGIEKNRPVIYLDAKGEWNSDAVVDAANGLVGYDGSSRILFAPVAPGQVTARQAIEIESVDASNGRFEIRNNLQFTNLSSATIEYNVTSGRKKISSGAIKLDVLAESATEFTIPLKRAKAGEPLNFIITVKTTGNTASRAF